MRAKSQNQQLRRVERERERDRERERGKDLNCYEGNVNGKLK